MGGYFFDFDYTYDDKAAAKHFTPEAAERLEQLADRFEGLDNWSADAIETTLTGLAEELEVKKALLIHPTRLAVSGMPVGPGLYDLLATLDRQIVLDRMRRAVEHIRKKVTTS
ncbi:MAG: hypothetical protein D6800_05160 [Candidatus Zixiibacteriota bacterium]|nr:MAG: hypothetical protein D6800_05160 [candidate division Zixibacteria bacterium]